MNRMSWSASLLSILACSACGSGAASTYKGGIPDKPIATYTTPFCVAKDGTKQAGPPVTYYLTRSKSNKLVLLQLDEFGQGISYGSPEAENDGYTFTVRDRKAANDAFRFVIPPSTSANGTRYVYSAGSYQAGKKSTEPLIIGEPSFTCEMVNKGDGASSAEPQKDAPDAGEPTPTPGRACVPGQTQECVGSGACKGGQVCLPDGAGFGPCDCGTAPASSSAP